MKTVTIEDYKKWKREAKKIILEKDFVIPKGTIFELMEGDAHFYSGANYEALIEVNKDNCGRFIVGTEIEDTGFEPIPEKLKPFTREEISDLVDRLYTLINTKGMSPRWIRLYTRICDELSNLDAFIARTEIKT